MATPLIISIILLLFGIIFVVCSFGRVFKDGLLEFDMFVFGTIMCIIAVVFGFGIICNTVPIRTEQIILIPDELVKSPYTLFIKYEGETITSTDAKMVMAPNSSIRIRKIIKYNSYGKKCNYEQSLIILPDAEQAEQGK